MASKYFRAYRQQYSKIGILKYQKGLIEKSYEYLTCKIVNDVLICSGTISCIDYANDYKVQITCVSGKEPHSKIIEPNNIKPSKYIHMYEDSSLCLHYPPDMKWSGWTPIYKYTIPWVSEWILYYELYLINGGKWEGPESPIHFSESEKNLEVEILK